MTARIDAAVRRLHDQLPLRGRQEALSEDFAELHRAILRSLAERGRPLSRAEIEERVGPSKANEVLKRLGDDDLVVLDSRRQEVIGAYPLTVEATPHHLRINGQSVNAMCALDALSVGPMFDAEVEIHSRCHVTGEPIQIRLQGFHVLQVEPSPDVRVGVRWQDPIGYAAHSMCMEMVFLRDEATAKGWQNGDTENVGLFTLPEAIEFGAKFFNPLLARSK